MLQNGVKIVAGVVFQSMSISYTGSQGVKMQKVCWM